MLGSVRRLRLESDGRAEEVAGFGDAASVKASAGVFGGESRPTIRRGDGFVGFGRRMRVPDGSGARGLGVRRRLRSSSRKSREEAS
jgi:hypothetical protein